MYTDWDMQDEHGVCGGAVGNVMSKDCQLVAILKTKIPDRQHRTSMTSLLVTHRVIYIHHVNFTHVMVGIH